MQKHPPLIILILALTSSFGLLLALYRRLFVVLSLTNLSNNAVLCAASLEALQSGIKAFVLAYTNFCQNVSLPLPPMTENSYETHYKHCGDSEGDLRNVLLLRNPFLSVAFGAHSLPFPYEPYYITTKVIISYLFPFVNSF